MPPESISQRLTALRRTASWTQQELAHRMGVSAGHVSNVETGKDRPSASYLEKASAAFQMSVSEMLQAVPFRAKPPGRQYLKEHRKRLLKAFSRRSPSRPVATLRVAWHLAQFCRRGPELLHQLEFQKRSGIFWKGVRCFPQDLNGPEQIVALQFICRGADLEEIHPHDVGLEMPLIHTQGKWWLAVVWQTEDVVVALFPQVEVRTRYHTVPRLDYLAFVGNPRGRAVVNLEVDGPAHQGREAEDRRRAGEIGLPLVRVSADDVNRADFVPWLLGLLEKAIP